MFNIESYQNIINYFKNNNLKNIVMFSLPRSGTTFVSHYLPILLNFETDKVFTEAFKDKHYFYLKKFIKKKNNFFLHTNEFYSHRHKLPNKKNTLYLYLYRDPEKIRNSISKLKKNKLIKIKTEFFFEEYVKHKFPFIQRNLNFIEFDHQLWDYQSKTFDHSKILDFDSFKNHKNFILDRSRFTHVKQISNSKVIGHENRKYGFSFFDKFYLKIISILFPDRKLDFSYYVTPRIIYKKIIKTFNVKKY